MSDKEEYRVGQRVFFPIMGGINSYGRIIEVHAENSSLLIMGDNYNKYERLMSVVTVVK